MKFCHKGIDTVEVMAPNGEPSLLYNRLLEISNFDQDVALDLYLGTKVDSFTSWLNQGMLFNGSRIDKNGEPEIVEAEGSYFYYNGSSYKAINLASTTYSEEDLASVSYNKKAILDTLHSTGFFIYHNNNLYLKKNKFPEAYREIAKLNKLYPGIISVNRSTLGIERHFVLVNDSVFSPAYQIVTDESLKAADDADYYERDGKKYIRTNTFQRNFSSFARSSASRSLEDISTYLTNKLWRENRLKDDEKLEISIGGLKTSVSKNQYRTLKEKELSLPALTGKALHAIFASLEEKDPARAEQFKKMAEEYRVKAEMDKETLDDYAKLFTYIKDILGTTPADVVTNEVTVSLEFPKSFQFQDKNGITHTSAGIAGTIDRLTLHADGSYTITDFKTGSLIAGMGNLMNYASQAGVKMIDNALNRNVLNLTVYALMLKANNRSIRFRDINFLKLDKSGKAELLSSGESFDFSSALKLLKTYFKDKHYDFFEKNQDLFNVSNYFASDSKLNEELAEIMDREAVDKKGARATLLKHVISRFRDVSYTIGQFNGSPKLSDKAKEKLDAALSEYDILLEQIVELKLGYNPFKYGSGNYMGKLQAMFGNRYGQSNPLINSLSTLFAQAKNNIRTEFIDVKTEHDKLLKDVLEELKIKKNLVGANYDEMYSFLWNLNKDSLNMTTYKDEKWNTLTKAQKKYADFYRWHIRYHLFRTMNPAEGIVFIEKELKERTDLSESDKAILNKHKEELENTFDYNKFKISNYSDFIYYEGWVPRVARTAEERGSVKEYVSEAFKSNFIVSDEEAIMQLIPEGIKNIEGIPLKFMGSSEATAFNHKDMYTFNFEIMFNAFVSHVISKEHMDDVYNLGIGIKNFLEKQDTASRRELNKNNIEFVDSFIKGLILGKRQNSFTKTIRVGKANIDVDHMIRSLRSYFGVTTLALNVVGAVGTGINQSLKTMQAAIVGSIGVGNQDMDLKNSRKMMREIIKWKKDQMFGRVSGAPEAATANKMALFLDLFGYLPKSYNYYETGESHTQLLSKQGFIAPSWVNNDLLLKLYSSIDNLNYATYLAGQLYKMQTYVSDGNGGKKLVSMWDAYEVVNGKLTYIGETRGVNSNTGEQIGALTAEEVDKLRAYSERDLGSYREDERSSLDNSSLGSLYMMFKRWLPALVKRAFSGEYENMSLGQWMQSGNEIDPETGLPLMTWVPRVDEGFMVSFFKVLGIAGLAIKSMDAGKFKEDWNKMTPTQKENFWYALVRLGTFAALMLIIGAVFGDNDEDDQNLIKRQAIRIKNETVFEFIAFDFERWKDTLVSAPPVEKLMTTLEGYKDVIFRGLVPDMFGLEPDTIQSGDREGWYKGLVPAMRGTKYVSTMFGFWEVGKDWESLEKDIDAVRYQ